PSVYWRNSAAWGGSSPHASGNSRSTTGSSRSNPSGSRPITSVATCRHTATSPAANPATPGSPCPRTTLTVPSRSLGGARSRLVRRGPERVAVQAGAVVFHPLAGSAGDRRLALVVHVKHQRLGLVAAVPEQLLEHPRHVRHQVHWIIPDDRDPGSV